MSASEESVPLVCRAPCQRAVAVAETWHSAAATWWLEQECATAWGLPVQPENTGFVCKGPAELCSNNLPVGTGVRSRALEWALPWQECPFSRRPCPARHQPTHLAVWWCPLHWPRSCVVCRLITAVYLFVPALQKDGCFTGDFRFFKKIKGTYSLGVSLHACFQLGSGMD